MALNDGTGLLPLRFMGSCDSFNEADFIIAGVPMDATCSFRAGTRNGPSSIRTHSIGIEDYSPYLDKSLEDRKYFDCGDLDLPFGSVEKSLEVIYSAAKEIYAARKFPVFLGGEHLISVPVIRAAYETFGDNLYVFHFDAHADLRESYLDCSFSHACTIQRLCDFMPSKNIYQFGIRSGTKQEFSFASENTIMHKFKVLEPLKETIESLRDKPVRIYVTLDIDVVDPAYANGTGTPEPGGISSFEMLEAVRLLGSLNMCGFDLVEVSPDYDLSGRTALLAAKIIRELLLTVK